MPTRTMTPSLRFVAAMIAATAMTWALGDPRIVWHEIGSVSAGPVQRGDAPVVLDGRAGRAVQPLEVPLPVRPGWAGVHVAAAAVIEALDPHPADVHPRPAVVQLRFFAGPERLDEAHVAWLERGQGSAPATRLVTVPPGTDRMQLALIVRSGAGRHRFDVAPLHFVERDGPYLVGAALLALVWTMLLMSLSRATVRAGAERSVRHACIAAFALIVVGTGLSTSLPLAGASQLLRDALRTLPGVGRDGLEPLFDAGHFVAFALAGGVAGALRRQLGAGRATTLAALIALALASEALQRHLPDRTPSLGDLIVDLAGIATGLIIARLRYARAPGARHPGRSGELAWKRRRRRRRSSDRTASIGAMARALEEPRGERRALFTTPDILLVPDPET